MNISHFDVYFHVPCIYVVMYIVYLQVFNKIICLLFKVKIRAYTAWDKFADTHFSKSITTEFESSNLGLAVSMPILVLAILIVIVVYVRRRRMGSAGGGWVKKKRGEDHPHAGDTPLQPGPIDLNITSQRPVEMSRFVFNLGLHLICVLS